MLWLSVLVPAVASASTDGPVRVATYAYPAFDRAIAMAPLAELVGRVAGRPAHTQLFATPDALAEAVRKGEVDVAVTNLAAFLAVRDVPGVRPVAVPAPPATTLDRYRGVLLARADTGLVSVKALRGKAGALRYVEVLPGSTSGALVQAAALRAFDLKPDSFRSTARAGTHEGALARLIEGSADVAALAEGPWVALKADKAGSAAQLVELWRSEPLPPGPILCVQSARMACDGLGRALLADDADSRAAAASLSQGWTETLGARSFIRFEARRYRPFEAASGRQESK